MGYDPEAGHEAERFYVLRMYELTVYGHTVDAATKARYPEDFPKTLQDRAEGLEFACWHSKMCPDGEISSGDAEPLRRISFETFREAAEQRWPYLEDEGVTTEAPMMAIGTFGDDGEVVWEWDSLRGDLTGKEPDA